MLARKRMLFIYDIMTCKLASAMRASNEYKLVIMAYNRAVSAFYIIIIPLINSA
jgi:hypothetical protein